MTFITPSHAVSWIHARALDSSPAPSHLHAYVVHRLIVSLSVPLAPSSQPQIGRTGPHNGKEKTGWHKYTSREYAEHAVLKEVITMGLSTNLRCSTCSTPFRARARAHLTRLRPQCNPVATRARRCTGQRQCSCSAPRSCSSSSTALAPRHPQAVLQLPEHAQRTRVAAIAVFPPPACDARGHLRGA